MVLLVWFCSWSKGTELEAIPRAEAGAIQSSGLGCLSERSLIGGVVASVIPDFLQVLNSVKSRKKESDEDEILSS